MAWIIIGSLAAKHWIPDFRNPSDIDVISPDGKTTLSKTGIIIDAKWYPIFQKIIDASGNKIYADLSLLYTIKLSHSNWDINWMKTVNDLHTFKKYNPILNQEVFGDLQKLWVDIHGKKKVNLNQPLKEFFGTIVKRKYDHEWLHNVVKFGNVPRHALIKADNTKPLITKAEWETQSEYEKILSLIEEALVFAIERSNLDHTAKNSDKLRAFSKALHTLGTSATTGYFAQYVALNYVTVFNDHRSLWMNQLNNSLNFLKEYEYAKTS